jgi:hypothetical protein
MKIMPKTIEEVIKAELLANGMILDRQTISNLSASIKEFIAYTFGPHMLDHDTNMENVFKKIIQNKTEGL